MSGARARAAVRGLITLRFAARRFFLGLIALAAVGISAAGDAHAAGAGPATTTTSTTTTSTSTSTTTTTPTVTVSSNTFGRPVQPGFVGLSIEYDALPSYTGDDPHAVNPVFEQLVRNLAPHQAPVLRIGGDSTDRTWWPTPGITPPAGIQYSLTPNWLATTRALADDLGARMIMGVNLEAGIPKLEVSEARALLHGIGTARIEALELGNEPNLYSGFWWYTQPDGTHVYARPHSYSAASYQRELGGLARTLGATPLAGPAVGGVKWTSGLAPMLAAVKTLKLATYHFYPLNRCFSKPGGAEYPTLANLLNPADAARRIAELSRLAALAHRAQALFRLDELNSVSCSGEPGLSDTFAAALWAPDALFRMLGAGVDGVNFHTLPAAAYRLFSFVRAGNRWQGSVAPEYYGILLFEQAVPPGSQLLSVRVLDRGQLNAWAVRTPSGHVNVVLINDSSTASNAIALKIGQALSRATLTRLTAPNITATSQITLGGQSFAPQTETGRLAGPLRTVQLTGAHGAFHVTVPPASAALLSVVTSSKAAKTH